MALSSLRNQASRVAAMFILAFTLTLTANFGTLESTLATAKLSQAKSKKNKDSNEQADEEESAPTAEQRFAARVGITHEAIDLSRGTLDIRKVSPLSVEDLVTMDMETLWLARALYSETKRPEEMELVAWSIRNRVETGYRGKHSYEDVVLDPWQFSAFNRNSPKRGYFTSLTPQSQADKWQEALTVAHIVKNAPESLRPFSKETRHYYSERSMVGRRAPAWAVGKQPIRPNRPFALEAERFRFFEHIA